MKHEISNSTLLTIDDWRNVLKSNHISSHSGEVLIPEPSRRLRVTSNTANFVGSHEFSLLLASLSSEALSEARSNDDHVSLLELHSLLLRDGLDVFDGDLVVGEGVEGSAGFVCVALEVDEDTAGDHAATLVPVVEGWELAFEVLVAVGLGQLFDACLGAL